MISQGTVFADLQLAVILLARINIFLLEASFDLTAFFLKIYLFPASIIGQISTQAPCFNVKKISKILLILYSIKQTILNGYNLTYEPRHVSYILSMLS